MAALVAVPFPVHLHYMVSSIEVDEIVRFVNPRAFKIMKEQVLRDSILPVWFGHSDLDHFYQELQSHGFQFVHQGPEKGAFIHGLFLKGRPDLAARIHKRAGESTAARGPHTDDHHKEKEDYSDILQRLPHLGSAGRVVREDADLLAAAVAMVEALDETNDDDWDDDGEDEDPRMEHNGTNSASVATMLIATNNVASGAPPHFQAAVVDPSRRLPEPGMESLPMGTNLCGMLVHIAANRFVAGGDNEQQQQQHDQDRRFGPNAAVLNVLHQAMIEGLFPFDLDGEDDDHHHHHNDWMAYG